MPELTPQRLAEIEALGTFTATPTQSKGVFETRAERDLYQQLRGHQAALADLLRERKDLVRANAAAAEELVGWNGAL